MREGLAVPASLTFAPVDFEQQSLADGLRVAGFQSDRPAFFHWLGVVPYLTRDAISATFSFIASLPASEVVFDYSEPPDGLPRDDSHSWMTGASVCSEVGVHHSWVIANFLRRTGGQQFTARETVDETRRAHDDPHVVLDDQRCDTEHHVGSLKTIDETH
jgi:O-methyltransferase involved in polyketide biosynthesis